MTSDIAHRLARARQQAAQLADLAAAVAAAAPQQAQGSDATATVQVVLAGDGVPQRIRVRADWRRRLDPARLGDAVVQANAEAVREGMRRWSAGLDQASWSARCAQIDAAGTTAAATDDQMEFVSAGRARDLAQLTEEVLTGLRTLRSRTAQAPVTAGGHGQDRSGHVSVILGPGGIVACTIDPAWATRVGGGVEAALTEAVQAARRSDQEPDQHADLDALAADALATLRAITNPAPASGGGPTRAERGRTTP